MRLPTYRLRHRKTKEIRVVNQTDYQANLSKFSDYERIGETRGEGNEMIEVSGVSTEPPAGGEVLANLATFVTKAKQDNDLDDDGWAALTQGERDALILKAMQPQTTDGAPSPTPTTEEQPAPSSTETGNAGEGDDGKADADTTDIRAKIDAECEDKRAIEARILEDFKEDTDLRVYNTRDKLLDRYVELHTAAAAKAAEAGQQTA